MEDDISPVKMVELWPRPVKSATEEAKMKLRKYLEQKIADIDYPKQIDGFSVSIQDTGFVKTVELNKTIEQQTITIDLNLNCEKHAVSPEVINRDMSEETPKPFDFIIKITQELVIVRLECSYVGTNKEDVYCYKINKLEYKKLGRNNINDQGRRDNLRGHAPFTEFTEVVTLTLKNLLRDLLIEYGVTDELFKKIYNYASIFNKIYLDEVKQLQYAFLNTKQ